MEANAVYAIRFRYFHRSGQGFCRRFGMVLRVKKQKLSSLPRR